MLQGDVNISLKNIPRGDSCEGCPYRGAVTIYDGEDNENMPCCLLLGVIDIGDRKIAMSSMFMKTINSGKIARDEKVCKIRL